MPDELMHHPVMPTLLMALLSLYPLMRIYARVGLPRGWAFLIFSSILIPFSGYLLAVLPLVIFPWPHFPKPPEKTKPVKTPI